MHKVLWQQAHPVIGRNSKFHICYELLLRGNYKKSTNNMIATIQGYTGNTCIGLSTDETRRCARYTAHLTARKFDLKKPSKHHLSWRFRILGHDTIYAGLQLSMFWMSLLSPPSAKSSETPASMCLSTIYIATKPRIFESSMLPWDPQTAYLLCSKTAASKMPLRHQHTTECFISQCSRWHRICASMHRTALYIQLQHHFWRCFTDI